MKEKTINIDGQLVDQLKEYKKNSKIPIKTVITQLITDFLKNKVLNKDGITLNKPFYFKSREFLVGECEATQEKPISNLKKWIKINKVPNNLDTWNTAYNTYSTDNAETEHKGILQVIELTKEELITYDPYVHIFHMMFKYNVKGELKNALEMPHEVLKVGICYADDLEEMLNKNEEDQFKLYLDFHKNIEFIRDYDPTDKTLFEIKNDIIKNIPIKKNVLLFDGINKLTKLEDQ